MSDMSDLEGDVRNFSAKVTPTHRYASFDYCFNYFQACRDDPARLLGSNLEQSCSQLAFYLASWGMLRGSTFLLQHSMKHLAPVVECIAAVPRELWELDLDGYDQDGIQMILDSSRGIRASFTPDPVDGIARAASDTLVTKVMLGVFGCVPAFDRNFKRGFGVRALNAASLGKVGGYYKEHAAEVDMLRQPTIDFATGRPTSRLYTRAKVLDMAFFTAGA